MKHIAPLETRSALLLETRDEDDPLAAATAAVDELRTGFESFQTRAEERITNGFRDIGDRVTAIETRLNRPGITTTRTDADANLERRAFNRMLRYGRDALTAEETRALTVTGGGATGENLVPETFLREIVKELTEISPMRSLARVTNVGGTPVLLPKRTGKPSGAWEGETSEAGETSSAYDQWSIPVFEARVHTDTSNRLLEDSAFDMESEIRTDLAEAFAELEAVAFLKGNGTTAPAGLITDPDFETTEADAIAIDADELIDLFYSLKGRYRRNGRWAMNAPTIAAVRKLKNPISGDYLWRDSLADGQPPTLLGAPVEEMVDLDDVAANAVPIVFGDFERAYRIVQRLALTVLPDRYSQATKSTVRFHARMRVGGKLILPEAVRGLRMPAE